MLKKSTIEITKSHRLLTRMHLTHFLNNEKKNDIFYAIECNEYKLL